MGKLLSLLARDDSNCCTPKTYDVFLDFENAAPTDTEREIYDEVERVLKESEAVLDEIHCYKVSFSSNLLSMRYKNVQPLYFACRCVCVCEYGYKLRNYITQQCSCLSIFQYFS